MSLWSVKSAVKSVKLIEKNKYEKIVSNQSQYNLNNKNTFNGLCH